MATKLSDIEKIVRGIVIDAIEGSDTPPLFSEKDFLRAVNAVKGDYWGVRPEAFVVAVVTVLPPSDLSNSRGGLQFIYDDTQVVLNAFKDLPAGILRQTFKNNGKDGTLFFSRDTDPEAYSILISLRDDGIRVSIVDANAPGTIDLLLPGSFQDNEWHDIKVTADLVTLTIECGGESIEAPWTGTLVPGSEAAYLGYSSMNGVTTWFEGAMAGFSLSSLAEEDYYALPMDEGQGYTLTELVSGNDATVNAPSVTWLTDDELDINQWAIQTYCYGVAAFLLRQRGKDSFFRKAADALHKLYTGG